MGALRASTVSRTGPRHRRENGGARSRKTDWLHLNLLDASRCSRGKPRCTHWCEVFRACGSAIYCCAVPLTISENGRSSPDASFAAAEKIQWSWSSLETTGAAPLGWAKLKGPGC